MPGNGHIVLLAEAAGGVARHVIDLYRGLKDREWSATLVMSPIRMEKMYSDELHDVSKEDLLLIPMRRSVHVSDRSVIAAIRQKLKSLGGPSILHAHSTKAGILGMGLGRPNVARVFTPHAYRSVDPSLRPTQRRFIRSAEAVFSRAYDRVIAVGPAEYKQALSLGISPSRVRLIANGVNINAFRSKRSEVSEAPVIGFLGRLVPQKDPLLFIRVFNMVRRLLPASRGVVFGDGPLKLEMQSLAKGLGCLESIEWRGIVPAVQGLEELDIMIHTSRYEGMPYSLVEAAAAGIPIVATRNDGSAAVMEGHLAEYIFPPESSEAMARATVRILRSKDELETLRSVLAVVSNTFSVDRMVNQMEEEYRSLLN